MESQNKYPGWRYTVEKDANYTRETWIKKPLLDSGLQQRTTQTSQVSSTTPVLQKSNGSPEIRRFELGTNWYEFKDTYPVEFRSHNFPAWDVNNTVQSSKVKSFKDYCDTYVSRGWTEISPSTINKVRRLESGSSNIWVEFKEENSVVHIRSHTYTTWTPMSVYTTVSEAVHDYTYHGWKEVAMSGFDPNDLQGKPCCGGVTLDGGIFLDGKWHALDCLVGVKSKLSGEKVYGSEGYLPTYIVHCECGSSHTVNANCHSTWCPAYKK